jgi:hypothetical protein
MDEYGRPNSKKEMHKKIKGLQCSLSEVPKCEIFDPLDFHYFYFLHHKTSADSECSGGGT